MAQNQPEVPLEPAEVVKVCVIFAYKGEEWSHAFEITKGSTVGKLKEAMVSPKSPPEDQIAFDLCKRRLRLSNLETVDEDETLEFRYLGPEEGKRLLERDHQVREREEEAARRSREQEELRREQERQHREEAEAARQERQRLEDEGNPPSQSALAPAPPAPAASKEPAVQQQTPASASAPAVVQDHGMTWIWTQKGLDAVSQSSGLYGHPKVGQLFTEANLQCVRAETGNNPGTDFSSLAREGYIAFGMPLVMAKVVEKAPEVKQEEPPQPTLTFTVTHKESREFVTLTMPPGQTIFDLKKAVSAEVCRGPSSKLTLFYRTGKLLGDSAKLDALSPEDRAGLLATGLDLGPPVMVDFKIFHSAKGMSGVTVMLQVEDTATFQDVKKALCDKFGAKTTEVRLMVKKPGATNLLGCKDSDRIQALREVGAAGKLMDRVAAGEAPVS